MNIAAAPGFVPAAHSFARPEKPPTPEDIDTVNSSVADPTESEAADESSDDRHGVFRLLQDGHFKGVAELRHRIRFHEKLAEEAAEEASEILEHGASDLVDIVREGVSALEEAFGSEDSDRSGPSDDSGHSEGGETGDGGAVADVSAESVSSNDLLADFEAAVEQAVDSDPTLNLETAEADLRAAYDTLVGALSGLYTPPTEDPEPIESVEAVAAADETEGETADAETDPLTTIIDSITESFEQALADLFAKADQALLLPDPEPAPGQGVAFTKFMTIYNELRGLGSISVDQNA